MIIISVLFGLISMLGYGFANAYSKPLSQELGAAHLIFYRGLTISVVLGMAAIPNYPYLFHHWVAVALAMALGIAGYIPVLAFTHGIRRSRLSVVAPIAATAPLVTVFLSFAFLKVAIGQIEWLAIALVVLANVLVSVEFTNWRESNLFQLSSGVPFALVAAAGWGLFYFFLVPSTRALGPWMAAFLVELGVTLAAGAHLLLTAHEIYWRDSLRFSVVLNGLLTCIATVAFTVGVRYFDVGVVAALGNSTALISSVLGVVLFKERMHIREKLGAGTMIIGIGIISFLHH